MPLALPPGGETVSTAGFSAPKGVERACPARRAAQGSPRHPGVSVPRRALRGHAPIICKVYHPARGEVSVPRRALRGHAPPESSYVPKNHYYVSVPRRALRGHAPSPLRGGTSSWRTRFSAPKGVERACPAGDPPAGVRVVLCFSAPKGVERACPLREHGIIQCVVRGFSAPKGVERACPCMIMSPPGIFPAVSVPRRALRGHAPQLAERGQHSSTGFSAPKGVERACPAVADQVATAILMFQCPEGR